MATLRMEGAEGLLLLRQDPPRGKAVNDGTNTTTAAYASACFAKNGETGGGESGCVGWSGVGGGGARGDGEIRRKGFYRIT